MEDGGLSWSNYWRCKTLPCLPEFKTWDLTQRWHGASIIEENDKITAPLLTDNWVAARSRSTFQWLSLKASLRRTSDFESHRRDVSGSQFATSSPPPPANLLLRMLQHRSGLCRKTANLRHCWHSAWGVEPPVWNLVEYTTALAVRWSMYPIGCPIHYI